MDPVERLALATREARFGEHGGVNPSIEVSTTFTVLDAKTLPDIFNGFLGPDPKQGGCYLYGRSYSPTVQQLARQLAAMEATEAAYAVASGMAAISSAVLGMCNSGDHIVCSNCVYGGTFAFMKTYLPAKCGIAVTFVDITDTAAVAAAMTPHTKVVYCETVSNPTLVVADLPALATIAHARDAALVVDNTFTPLAVTPSAWGADVVVHSMTKFVSGSSDIIAGAVCGSAAFIGSLMDLHTGPIMLQGPTMDPRIASELLMRLPHLHLRMAEHCRRAGAMAQALGDMGAKVSYPGLPQHKGHGVLSRLLNRGYGYGGLIGVDMGTPAKAEALMERLQNKHGFGLMAVSLGYADTLMSLSSASTSSELTAADKAAADISDGYVRMSVGITGTLEQRLSQLREAYEFVTHTNGLHPYKATKVRVAPDGSLQELVSWPSWGPEEDDDGHHHHDIVMGEEMEGKQQHNLAAAAVAAAETETGTETPGPEATAGPAPGPAASVIVVPAAVSSASPGKPCPASSPLAAAMAAAVAAVAAAAPGSSSATGGNSSGQTGATLGAEGGPSSDEATGGLGGGGGGAGNKLTGVSRLAVATGPIQGASSGGVGIEAIQQRPVKIRKLDADTHVVYRPTSPAGGAAGTTTTT